MTIYAAVARKLEKMFYFVLLSTVLANEFKSYDEPLTECAWNFFDYKERRYTFRLFSQDFTTTSSISEQITTIKQMT